MPQISRFFGITIWMYHNDHLPVHFHAEYGEYEALYNIGTFEIIKGELPMRAHALVIEWASIYRNELRENWERARRGEPLCKIEPLE